MSEIDLQKQIDAMRIRLESLERIEYPPIACRVYNSATFTHDSSGGYKAITFNSEHWDPTGMHSTSSNTSRITFALGGWYEVGGLATFAANATGIRELGIYLNATTIIHLVSSLNMGTDLVRLGVSTLYYFSASAYVELIAFQNSGGNLDIAAAGDYSQEFWAIRLP